MLADACEAAVRSLTKPTPTRIESMVRKIIHDRLDDDQLEQSPLTFRDLDLIAEAFKRVLTACFHQRIEYPDLPELRGRNGDDDGQNINGKTMGSRNGAAGLSDRPNGTEWEGGQANGVRPKGSRENDTKSTGVRPDGARPNGSRASGTKSNSRSNDGQKNGPRADGNRSGGREGPARR